MKALPTLFLAGACSAFASPAPVIGPGNLVTYNDYDFSLPPGDLDFDIRNIILPADTTISPADPLTVVLNFSAPVSFVLEPDYVHHGTPGYTFGDWAELIDVTYELGSFSGGVDISLYFDNSFVFGAPSLNALEGYYYNPPEPNPNTANQYFTDVYQSPTYVVPFGPPVEITFTSAVYQFTQSKNVTLDGFSAGIDGYLPETTSTLVLLGVSAVALVGTARWIERRRREPVVH